MKHAPSMLLIAALAACGGEASNVSSSNDVTSRAPTGHPPAPASAAPAASPTDAPPRAPATADAPSIDPDALVADVRLVCQAVLDAPQLQQYIAPSPRHVPLHLIAGGPCNGLALEKHGKAVIFDGGPRDVSITEVALTGSGASARMRYGDQGIVGELEFERSAGRFRLVKGSVVEH
jgi:hypothetical protein